MACSSGGCSSTGGCGSGGCGTGSCNRLNVFDWLSNMHDAIPASQKTDLVEIRFKGGRKEIFRNSSNLTLYTGDPVVVEVTGGHHIGFISLQGELVKLQMKKKNIPVDENIKQIYRLATEKDLEKYELSKQRELNTIYRSRELIQLQKLQMKLSDVEFQADNTKATFFYSAEERVDFRELIKILASEFKIRVEMKQISLRQEASRLGGIGVCGRELCCSTWLSDFKSVSTTAARYQNLSLNPAKLSGQCGRLKCCLNYELDTYMDALKDIPTIEQALMTEKGEAYLQKTDIFRKIMWFAYKNETAWYPLSIDLVLKIVELNKQGNTPPSLNPEEWELSQEDEKGLNNDLADLDKKYSNKSSKKKKKKRPNQESNGNFRFNQPNTNTPVSGEQAPRNQSENLQPRNKPSFENRNNENVASPKEVKQNNFNQRRNFDNQGQRPQFRNQDNRNQAQREKPSIEVEPRKDFQKPAPKPNDEGEKAKFSGFQRVKPDSNEMAKPQNSEQSGDKNQNTTSGFPKRVNQ